MTGPCSSGHDNFDRSTPVEIVVPLFGISGGQRRKRAAPPIDYQYGDLDPYDGDEPCCGRVMPLPRGQGNRQDARSLRRFALHLVHKHFDLAAHEVLVEYSDPIPRAQHLRVEWGDSAAARSAMPTTWILEEDRPLVTCVCVFRGSQGHLGRHESV